MVKKDTDATATEVKAEDKPKRVIRSYDERIAELQQKAEAKAAKDKARAEKNYETLVSEFQLAGQKLDEKGAKLAETAKLLGKGTPAWAYTSAEIVAPGESVDVVTDDAVSDVEQY